MVEINPTDTQYSMSGPSPYLITDRGKLISIVQYPLQLFGLYNIKYSLDGNLLVSSFGQGTIQLRNGRTGEVIRTIRSGSRHSLPVMCSKFHPKYLDCFFSSTSDGVVFKCGIEKGTYERFIEERGNEIASLDIGCDGLHLVTGGRDSNIRVYDINNGQLKHTYTRGNIIIDAIETERFHGMRIFCIKFYPPNPDIFLSGGWDDSVKIWDLRDKTGCVRSFFGPHICGEAIDVRDKNIITGSWAVQNSLQLWDFGSGNLIETIIPQNRSLGIISGEYMYACQFMDGDPSNDLIVAGGSGTGHIEVISIRDKIITGHFKVNKACHTLDTYRRLIAFGGMDPEIKIVDYNIQ